MFISFILHDATIPFNDWRKPFQNQFEYGFPRKRKEPKATSSISIFLYLSLDEVRSRLGLGMPHEGRTRPQKSKVISPPLWNHAWGQQGVKCIAVPSHKMLGPLAHRTRGQSNISRAPPNPPDSLRPLWPSTTRLPSSSDEALTDPLSQATLFLFLFNG